MMGMRVGGQDSFVVVSYDFEYTSEEGKRVWMKEGEVLLLLAKTNNDWWQVIRRGDRRPFYAPARYVAELSNDAGEWDSAFSGEGVHYRPDNGEPIGFQEKKSHFSTFLGGGNKRSSYAPPPTHHGPPSSDFLFGAPSYDRFQERYRSNSMDSILVADLNRQMFKPRQFTTPVPTPPIHHLEKRPTFDNIDKRSSWSHDKSPQYLGGRPAAPFPVYPNPVITAPVLHASVGLPMMSSKKPVPLPRSKIPLPTKAATIDRIVQPELRTFKRSKTDLSLGMLSQYKASRAVQGSHQNRIHGALNSQGRSGSSSSNSQGRSSASIISGNSQGRSSGSVISSLSQDNSRTRSQSNMNLAGSQGRSQHSNTNSQGRSQHSNANSQGRSPSSLKSSTNQVLSPINPGRSPGNSNRAHAGINQSRRPSTNRPVSRPSIINEEKSSQSLKNDIIQNQKLQILENTDHKGKFGEFKQKPVGEANHKSASDFVQSEPKPKSAKSALFTTSEVKEAKAPPKPAIKEKPCVPLIKSNLNSTDKDSVGKQKRLQKAQSESDLMNRTESHRDAEAQTLDVEDELKISLKVEGFDRVAADDDSSMASHVDVFDNQSERSDRTSAERTERALQSSQDRLHERASEERGDHVDGREPRDRRGQERRSRSETVDPPARHPDRSESKENLNPQGNETKSSKKFVAKKETTGKFLDMEPLPEPPPTPPSIKVAHIKDQVKIPSDPINIPGENGSSQPLVISTEPMSTSSNSGLNKSEDKSNCSSSFDSLDGSLDSSGWPEGGDSAGWPEGGDWLGSEPNRGSLVSPNNSTCSRAPSSPVPGTVPLRHVFTDWDEYLDSSGRKFYYNLKTREKSWKPPRRIRGTSEGYSAPTSPDPFQENVDSAFEMSPGLSESESRSVEDEQIRLDKPPDGNPTSKMNEMLKKLEATTKETTTTIPEIRTEETVSEPVTEGGVPSGYEVKTDPHTGEQYYVNVFTGVSWYSAQDKNGRTYYYEENGNESCWELPNVSQTFQDHSVNPSPVPDADKQKNLVNQAREPMDNLPSSSIEPSKSSDLILSESSKTESLRQKFYHGGPNVQIGDVSIVVVKQGSLYKTRLEERGKRYRKNWAVSNLVLTDMFLLFYKDSKAFANLQSGGGANKPDQCIDLKGAQIEWCNSDKSKRSNVFEISTVLEQKLLLQDDDFTVANDWFSSIEHVIVNLSQKELVVNSRTVPDGTESASSTLQSKKSKVGRTKSLKLLPGTKDGNAGSAAGSDPDSPSVVSVPLVKEKSRIREKLRKFFLRRPGVEDLMKRGIMKNEPVFGSTLVLLSKVEHSDVPLFVRKCIQVIESRPEYLCTDGVYRQSGNLSTVQRLRLQIDHGNANVLDTVDDVHVLTGALKLFFRELKEPLIPWDSVEKLINVCNLPSKKSKIKGIKDIVQKLPTAHQATLIALLKHLEKVTTFKEVNRMAVSNLAIVFGPTLMWPPAHLTNTNMALNMMQQNMIVEALISNLCHIS